MRLDKEQEKWAIFWCDLLSPVIYDEIEAELTNRFLKQLAKKRFGSPTGESATHRFLPCAVNSIATGRVALTPWHVKAEVIVENPVILLLRSSPMPLN